MSDGSLLLEAIRRRPDDDLVRLVYADWLDENGDPARAEFIRAQIEAERQPAWSAEHKRAAARADELLAAYHPRWTEGYAEVLARDAHERVGACPCSGAPGLWFSRGFVEEVCLKAEVFFSVDGYSLRPEGPLPTLRLYACHQSEERYDGLERYVDDLAASPLLALCRDLHIACGFSSTTDEGLTRLACKPDLLAKVSGLYLSEAWDVTDRGLLPVLESPHLVRLRELVADGLHTTEAILEPLIGSPRFRDMTDLWLEERDESRAAGRRLFETPVLWPKLRCLRLWGSTLDSQAVTSLIWPGAYPALESLDLTYGEADFPSARALLASGAFPRLRFLGLDGPPLTLPEVEELRSQFGERVEIHFPPPRRQAEAGSEG
jgi:uncharacterized protein (TIGR02996 family)